jgi:hypothetical protein
MGEGVRLTATRSGIQAAQIKDASSKERHASGEWRPGRSEQVGEEQGEGAHWSA